MDPSTTDTGVYFTISYILLTIVIVSLMFYITFVVYSYQSIKRTLVEKGRLLQIIPLISIATVNMHQAQPSTSFQIISTDMSTTLPPAYSGNVGVATRVTKEDPPPYTL